jgi:hypothetical protein
VHISRLIEGLEKNKSMNFVYITKTYSKKHIYCNSMPTRVIKLYREILDDEGLQKLCNLRKVK